MQDRTAIDNGYEHPTLTFLAPQPPRPLRTVGSSRHHHPQRWHNLQCDHPCHSFNHKTMKVLIIEDEQHNFNRLKKLLLGYGATMLVEGPFGNDRQTRGWLHNHQGNEAPDIVLYSSGSVLLSYNQAKYGRITYPCGRYKFEHLTITIMENEEIITLTKCDNTMSVLPSWRPAERLIHIPDATAHLDTVIVGNIQSSSTRSGMLLGEVAKRVTAVLSFSHNLSGFVPV